MRDRALGSTIRMQFMSTNPDGGGAPVAPSSAFAAADIRIYKDGSASEKATTNGITVTSPFDSITGLHLVEIDTSNSTGDVGFWASGSVYHVRLVTAKTVATYSVSGLLIGEFSIELQTADVRKFGGTAITAASGIPEVKVASIATDAVNAAALAANAVTEIQSGLATSTNVTDAQTAIIAQIDANETKLDSIQGDTNDIQSRLPAALEGGRIAAVLDSTGVTAIQSGLATAASITTLRGADNDTLKTISDQIDGIDDIGGSGDAEQATLLLVKAKTDLIGSAAAMTELFAAAVLEPGSITSFPETLRIGDSYTDVLGRGIQLPIVDTDGVPLTAAGSKDFADATATFVIKRTNDTEEARIITGSATFVDPPGTGTGESPYALIEIPSSETAKGLVKYRYTGLLTFTWPYVGTGTDAEVMTFETGTIVFDA